MTHKLDRRDFHQAAAGGIRSGRCLGSGGVRLAPHTGRRDTDLAAGPGA